MIHGCNNKGTFGAGVAKAVAQKWPEAKEAYLQHFQRWDGNPPLGSHSRAIVSGKSIFNLITQDGYGRDGKKYARYWAIIIGLNKIAYDEPEIAIPRIGCGFGGLDWNIMEKLLLEFENDFDVEFWVYDPS